MLERVTVIWAKQENKNKILTKKRRKSGRFIDKRLILPYKKITNIVKGQANCKL